MRRYQHKGLTPEAEAYLDEHCALEMYACPTCSVGRIAKHIVVKEETKDAFFGSGPTLRTYLSTDGTKIKEIVQAMPWSSGPVGFLCLKHNGTRIGEWPQEEVDQC